MKNVNDYKESDCGRFGKVTECNITGSDSVKTAGRVDWTYLRKRYEIKTGAGELGNVGERLVKGASMVLYIPIPEVEADGSLDVARQEGFILTRTAFLEAIETAGLLREKTSTSGSRKVTIQTFWNRKLNKPHGKGYERLLDALYENCEQTLEELIAERAEA